MSVIQRSALASFLSYLAVVAMPSIALATDELTSKVQTAWEKFSELEETKGTYGERAEVAVTMLQTERVRTEVEAMVRSLRVQIDSFPARRTNIQQEVYDEWLFARQRLTELDHSLGQLRSQLQEMNQIAIRQAEVSGKRVKPLDRVGLLNELQRVYRDCETAFDSLRTALVDAAGAQRMSAAQVLKNAMDDLGEGNDPAVHLVPLKQFRAAFQEYCRGQSSAKPKKSGRTYRKSKSTR